MSFFRLSLLTAATATALNAQSASPHARGESSPLLQTLTFGVSDALDERWRLTVDI